MADIPINAVPRRVQFTGNTGLGPFAFSFEILLNTDIAVYKNSTLLTITTDYTVTINANGTGSVTLTGSGSGTALVASDYLTIIGDKPLARTTDFTTAGDLLASALNEQLDSSVVMTQQVSERVDRALRQDPDDVDGDMTIPDKATRLGKYLRFNDTTGDPEAGDVAGLYTSAGMNNYNFTGDGSATAFTLGIAPGAENNTQTYIDGVYQQKDTYTVSGTTLTFSTAPPNLSTIEVMVIQPLAAGENQASEISFKQDGSSVERNVQLKLQETVSVKDFGATGDGTTDDTAAIQAAIDSIEPGGSARRGTVYFPPGNYRTTQMLTINGTSVGLKGDSGELCTTITGDFTGTGVADSAIIKINGRYCYVKNIAFSASATREAATNVHAHAIWIEADDNGTADSNHGVYQSLFIEKQPGDGIVGIAKIWNTTFDNIRVRDCKGHGFCFDNGTKTSRTNEANPGEVIINNCQVFDNGGHALLIGNTNENHNRGFRFQVNNFDAYRNAESAGVRITADQIWAFCDTTRFESCAVDGFNQAESSVVTNGIKILGQNIGIYNTRFLNVLAHAVTVDEQLTFPTFGIIIENIYLYANTPVQLDPVVNVSSSVQDVKVSLLNPLTSNQAAPVSTTLGIPLDKRVVVSSKSATQTINNTTTLVDVTDMKVVLLPKERVQFRFSILYRGDSTADIKFQFTKPSGANIAWAPVNSIYIGTSDAISIKDVNFGTASTIQCGCNNSNQTRIIELVGEVLTTGTGGDLQLQFAQNVAVGNDTEILGQSYAVGYRM